MLDNWTTFVWGFLVLMILAYIADRIKEIRDMMKEEKKRNNGS